MPTDEPWRHRSNSVVPNPRRQRRCGRCASARATSWCERRPDGTIHLHSPHALAPYPAKLTERLEYWAATAPERTSWRSATPPAAGARSATRETLRAGPAHRRGAAATRSLARAADRHPLRQRHRARAARPRRHLCRRSLRADLARLFADLERLRQAPHTSSTCSRRVSSSPPTAAPTAARSRRWCRPTWRSSSRATRSRAGRRRRSRRCWRRRRRRPSTRRTPGRARHHRQVPVHLGLDRHAEGGDQHPAHVVLEPGDDPLPARLLRGRAAGDRGLVALAPHRRRQPQFRLRALQRRHLLHRRGQAGAGR